MIMRGYVIMKIKDKKGFTEFELRGVTYQFSTDAFNAAFREYLYKQKKKVGAGESELAEAVSLSKDAIHQWRYGNNGPGDLETIIKIADYFKIDFYRLLKEVPQVEASTEVLSDRQMEALRRIYCAIWDFLEQFRQNDGFVWEIDDRKSIWDGDDIDKVDYAIEQYDQVGMAIKKEYLDLGKTELYKNIEQFWDVDLFDMWNGKQEPWYRFDFAEQGKPTATSVEKELTDIIRKLHTIIDPYL